MFFEKKSLLSDNYASHGMKAVGRKRPTADSHFSPTMHNSKNIGGSMYSGEKGNISSLKSGKKTSYIQVKRRSGSTENNVLPNDRSKK